MITHINIPQNTISISVPAIIQSTPLPPEPLPLYVINNTGKTLYYGESPYGCFNDLCPISYNNINVPENMAGSIANNITKEFIITASLYFYKYIPSETIGQWVSWVGFSYDDEIKASISSFTLGNQFIINMSNSSNIQLNSEFELTASLNPQNSGNCYVMTKTNYYIDLNVFCLNEN